MHAIPSGRPHLPTRPGPARGSNRLDVVDPLHDAFAVEKPRRQLLVLPGCPHGDHERPSINADFERLLHGDVIRLEATAAAPDRDRPDAAGRMIMAAPQGRAGGIYLGR